MVSGKSSRNNRVGVAFDFQREQGAGMVMATRFIDTRRSHSSPRADEAQVLHLRHAARSAGEAFAFEEELSRPAPSRSYSVPMGTSLVIAAAIVLALLHF